MQGSNFLDHRPLEEGAHLIPKLAAPLDESLQASGNLLRRTDVVFRHLMCRFGKSNQETSTDRTITKQERCHRNVELGLSSECPFCGAAGTIVPETTIKGESVMITS
jgi:hypothetical protein